MVFHPRNSIRFRQIGVFGIIWLIFGLFYVLIEYGLIGTLDAYPTTGNTYSFKESLIIVSLGSLLMGFIQGAIEVLWMRSYVAHFPLWKKLLFKSIFYTVLVIIFLCVLTLITNAIILERSIFSKEVLDSLLDFISEFVFWTIVLYIGFILDVALFYSEIETHLGKNALANYLGKYHRPKKESRIFMFLDMKSSTTIAESIGHERYFELLKSYYADMTNAVIETYGDIYQYVGDEIVVTWKELEGIKNNNCIECFVKISEAIDKNKAYYLENFGLVPEFKAGFHLGEVTAGEIGIIKKDIIYTGDVLNTTARIQSQCNLYGSIILISEDLLSKLKLNSRFEVDKLEENISLKGKRKIIQLFDIKIKK